MALNGAIGAPADPVAVGIVGVFVGEQGGFGDGVEELPTPLDAPRDALFRERRRHADVPGRDQQRPVGDEALGVAAWLTKRRMKPGRAARPGSRTLRATCWSVGF